MTKQLQVQSIRGINMARSENNLTAVFTDTANAIREKTGDSALIIPRDFADAIANISGGGGKGGFDFSGSTFTSIPSGMFLGNTMFEETDIYFPATLSSWSNTVFGSGTTGLYRIHLKSKPTLSSTSYFPSATASSTFKPVILIGKENYVDFITMTNWSSRKSQIYIEEKGFATGTTLTPYVYPNGTACTWYKAPFSSETITISEGASNTYYGQESGTTRLVCFFNVSGQYGSVNIAHNGSLISVDGYVEVGETITITPISTDSDNPDLYSFVVNGTNYTSQGSATITAPNDSNITISVVYYNQSSGADAILANNTWLQILLADKSNNIPSTWAVGDTKDVVINGLTYQARLTDKTGKYIRVSDGSTVRLKFELTELLPTSQVYNSSSNNRPLQSPLLADINSGTIYGQIESALTSVLEPVKVKVSQGGGSSTQDTLVDFEGKFFFHREHDLFSTRGSSVQAEWDAISNQDEYYQTHNTNADRVKHLKGQTNGMAYWEMSPCALNSNSVCSVLATGRANYYGSTSSAGVCLCFAI